MLTADTGSGPSEGLSRSKTVEPGEIIRAYVAGPSDDKRVFLEKPGDASRTSRPSVR